MMRLATTFLYLAAFALIALNVARYLSSPAFDASLPSRPASAPHSAGSKAIRGMGDGR